MIVIVCLDEDGGMMFNNRRQSRDKAVTERIRRICKGRRLWMNAYSANLYGNMEDVEILVDEDFPARAGREEMCLTEDRSLKPFADKIEGILVFRWNRRYPADLWFDLDLSEWERVSAREFAGNSHEQITEEYYKKRCYCSHPMSLT